MVQGKYIGEAQFNRKVRLQNSPIMLHIATSNKFIFVDNLENLVDLGTLKTKIISFQDATLPLDYTLRNLNNDLFYAMNPQSSPTAQGSP
jgi:hypothetical protein